MRIRNLGAICLLASAGCAFIQTVALTLDLLRAIESAAPGEKACAAFDVLNSEANGTSVSRLVNAALAQTNSSVRLTSEEGDSLLSVIRVVNCEFISCYVSQLKDQSPPQDDGAIAQWVEERFPTLSALGAGCPSATVLTSSQLIQLVRVVVALKL